MKIKVVVVLVCYGVILSINWIFFIEFMMIELEENLKINWVELESVKIYLLDFEKCFCFDFLIIDKIIL